MTMCAATQAQLLQKSKKLKSAYVVATQNGLQQEPIRWNNECVEFFIAARRRHGTWLAGAVDTQGRRRAERQFWICYDNHEGRPIDAGILYK